MRKEVPPPAWSEWASGLSRAARKALEPTSRLPVPAPVQDAHEAEFLSLRAGLTRAAREALDGMAASPPSYQQADARLARPCLVEAPDGDWPLLRQFHSLEDLVRRLGQLEGEDVVAWAFFGIPLPFTRGPQRYLALPDGVRAITVPLYEGGPIRAVPLQDVLDTLGVQEDGFLGPPELSDTRIVTSRLEGQGTPPVPSPGGVTLVGDDEGGDTDEEGEEGGDPDIDTSDQ
jgi:hypothetical protein